MKSLRCCLGLCLGIVSTIQAQATVAASAEPVDRGAHPSLEGYFPGADGVRLFFHVVGSGSDTIVVIHGGPATSLKEALDLEPLADRNHTLIFYDQRGAGMSELVSPPARLGLPSHVEDLEAVRRRFRLGRLSIITISWGSAIALHYAIAHPGMVDRVAMLNPFPPTGRAYVQRFAHLDSLRDQKTKSRLRTIDSLWPVAPDSELAALCRESGATASRAYTKPGSAQRQPRGDICDYPPDVLRFRRTARIAALRGLGAEYDFTDALTRFTRPMLVVEGAESRLPLEPARVWAAKAPDARLLLVKGSGHRTWVDGPEDLMTALDQFFHGAWPATALVVDQAEQ